MLHNVAHANYQSPQSTACVPTCHPIVLANLQGFWDPLVQLFDHFIERKFTHDHLRSLYSVVDNVEDLLPHIEAKL